MALLFGAIRFLKICSLEENSFYKQPCVAQANNKERPGGAATKFLEYQY